MYNKQKEDLTIFHSEKHITYRYSGTSFKLIERKCNKSKYM